MRPRADWIGILEAAYGPAPDDQTWARDVLDATRSVFRRIDGIGMQVVEHDAECATGQVLVAVGTGPSGELMSVAYEEDLGALGPAGFRSFFYPPTMVMTHSELDPLLTDDVRDTIESMRSYTGLDDQLGIVVHPEPGMALVLSCALDRRTKPTPHERTLLAQVGLHLETAYRLRRHPDVVKAVLTLQGSSKERAPDAPDDALLGERARQIELSLSMRGRQRHEAALDLWPALIDGRYSLVRREDGSSHHYLVLENKRQAQEIRALTQREIEVLSMAARGLSTKLVSYGLGLSSSMVSAALARAASKLGLASRLELLRLAATLGRDPRSRALPETITAAESEVLALLGEGLSNDEIAKLRSRSTRTVANQVASLLRKTGSATRRGLITVASSTAALGPPPAERREPPGPTPDRTDSEEEV